MKRTITLNTFRKVEAAEEAMARAMMPRTSAASPEPLVSEIRNAVPRKVWRAGVATTLTYTLQEVSRA